jgi:AraC family transcriptional regulator of adaptative response/methylated-DNA-[protein]-cysteine methyltransferase
MKSLNRIKNYLVELPISTRDGEFIAHYSEKGLAGLDFPKVGRASPRAVKPRVVPAQILRWNNTTAMALKAILAGREPKTFPPLDMSGTVFQKNVWRAMRKISLGKTKSYGEIASAIGNPKAVRAVGGACGANPVPVLVPCHRVLAANNKLGGFGGGLDWKRSLLRREGIKM